MLLDRKGSARVMQSEMKMVTGINAPCVRSEKGSLHQVELKLPAEICFRQACRIYDKA